MKKWYVKGIEGLLGAALNCIDAEREYCGAIANKRYIAEVLAGNDEAIRAAERYERFCKREFIDTYATFLHMKGNAPFCRRKVNIAR